MLIWLTFTVVGLRRIFELVGFRLLTTLKLWCRRLGRVIRDFCVVFWSKLGKSLGRLARCCIVFGRVLPWSRNRLLLAGLLFLALRAADRL